MSQNWPWQAEGCWGGCASSHLDQERGTLRVRRRLCCSRLSGEFWAPRNAVKPQTFLLSLGGSWMSEGQIVVLLQKMLKILTGALDFNFGLQIVSNIMNGACRRPIPYFSTDFGINLAICLLKRIYFAPAGSLSQKSVIFPTI